MRLIAYGIFIIFPHFWFSDQASTREREVMNLWNEKRREMQRWSEKKMMNEQLPFFCPSIYLSIPYLASLGLFLWLFFCLFGFCRCGNSFLLRSSPFNVTSAHRESVCVWERDRQADRQTDLLTYLSICLSSLSVCRSLCLSIYIPANNDVSFGLMV